jgi:hypothetical protein
MMFGLLAIRSAVTSALDLAFENYCFWQDWGGGAALSGSTATASAEFLEFL